MSNTVLLGQGNNLSGSPYSLFGLGVPSVSNVGIQARLQGAGLAFRDFGSINLSNPAAFSQIPKGKFLFDVGISAQLNSLTEDGDSETRFASNFSNLAFAFSVSSNSGMGLSLIPSSDVGYALLGLRGDIEGSPDAFFSNVFGSGGINQLKLDYGIGFYNRINAGLRVAYQFGTIDQREQISIEENIQTNTALIVEESTLYTGFSFGIGLQYKLSKWLDIGILFDSGAILNGKLNRNVSKILDFQPSLVSDVENEPIDDFIQPVSLGMGLAFKLSERWSLLSDYTSYLWSLTNQSDNIGVFVDQHRAALGFNYAGLNRPNTWIKRWDFGFGFSYDSGYIEIDERLVNSVGLSAGLGIPIGNQGSKLNFSYTYNNNGSANGVQIQEQLHTININFSLTDLWFQKRKYN